jgi:AcrR family transcriptional regulator
MDLVRDQGCSAFSIEAVAARAGVSKQSVYRRWSSRGDLLVDLYLGSLHEPPLDKGSATFRDAFTEYMEWSVRRLFDPARANILRGLAMEAQADGTIRQLLLARIVEPRLEIGRKILRRGIAAGDVRPDIDVEMALNFVIGTIWFSLLITGLPIDRQLQRRILDEFFALTAIPISPA